MSIEGAATRLGILLFHRKLVGGGLLPLFWIIMDGKSPGVSGVLRVGREQKQKEGTYPHVHTKTPVA
jgi:hypothetical protein